MGPPALPLSLRRRRGVCGVFLRDGKTDESRILHHLGATPSRRGRRGGANLRIGRSIFRKGSALRLLHPAKPEGVAQRKRYRVCVFCFAGGLENARGEKRYFKPFAI